MRGGVDGHANIVFLSNREIVRVSTVSVPSFSKEGEDPGLVRGGLGGLMLVLASIPAYTIHTSSVQCSAFATPFLAFGSSSAGGTW